MVTPGPARPVNTTRPASAAGRGATADPAGTADLVSTAQPASPASTAQPANTTRPASTTRRGTTADPADTSDPGSTASPACTVSAAARLAEAREIAGTVPDPELPMVTVADLGILRDVSLGDDGSLVVTITPTYSGCPALTEIARALHGRLTRAGLGPVVVRTALAPAWTTDWITDEGRRKLRAAGVAPPGPARHGPVPLTLSPGPGSAAPYPVPCPLCGSPDTEVTAAFSGTACKALRRCLACGEPFEAVKAL